MAPLSRRVIGRFIAGMTDGPDPDQEPDIIPMQGTVTFTCSVPYWTVDDGISDPAVFVPTTFVGVIDSEGYLCTPDPADPTKPGYRGIRLFTNDDPNASVTGWTWQVTYRMAVVNGTTPAIKSHPIALVSSPDDYVLPRLIDIPSSPGVGVPQAFALVDRAEGAAVASAGSAADAAAVAQSVRDDADSGAFDGDTLTMGTVTTVPAGGTPTATITGTSPNKVLDLGLVKGEPGGWVTGAAIAAGTHLDSITADGPYRQTSTANASLALGYPVVSAGVLTVLQGIGTATVVQAYIAFLGGTTGARSIWQRVRNGGVWGAWRTFNSVRTDQTAGRAIYQWDELNSREQLIYGDTGWRDITSLCDPAVLTAGGLRVRRKEYDLYIQILGGTVIASDDIVAVLPDRFRPDLASRVLALVGTVPAYGRFTGSGSNMRLPVGAYPEAVYLQPIPLTTAWPTTLPGTAVGTIPNT